MLQAAAGLWGAGRAGLGLLFDLFGALSLYSMGKDLLSGDVSEQGREDAKAIATLTESQKLAKSFKKKVTLNDQNAQMLDYVRGQIGKGGMWMGEGKPMPGQMQANDATRLAGMDDDRIAFANMLAQQLGPRVPGKPVKATDLLKATMVPRGGAYA